jgi:hypothetical protein
MQFDHSLADNPFAVLSFLAAPAILTNATTLLAMSTSNRLARASDRARAASSQILSLKATDETLAILHQTDFQISTTRARMLVQSLRSFYFAAGCFSAGTCAALLGAFSSRWHLPRLDSVTQALTMVLSSAGMVGLVLGAIRLVTETRLALRSLDAHHTAITRWRATHQAPPVNPGV